MPPPKCLTVAAAAAIGFLLAQCRAAVAEPVPLPGTQPVAVRMIEAIKDQSYEDFLGDGDEHLKSQFGRPQFDELCINYAAPLRKGYRLFYVDQLRRRKTVVLLWKMTVADSQDETLLTITMRDGKVEVFSIQ